MYALAEWKAAASFLVRDEKVTKLVQGWSLYVVQL